MASRQLPFQTRFWGVRGSIPTPGAQTRLVGGNTSCLEVRVGDEVLILDAGSGVRGLGEKLLAENVNRATFLFSHVHWDHILGFPYFKPAAKPGHEYVLFGERKAGAGIDEILEFQASQTHAPAVVPGRGARLLFEEVKPGDAFRVGDASITTARMNHPDGCLAFSMIGPPVHGGGAGFAMPPLNDGGGGAADGGGGDGPPDHGGGAGFAAAA